MEANVRDVLGRFVVPGIAALTLLAVLVQVSGNPTVAYVTGVCGNALLTLITGLVCIRSAERGTLLWTIGLAVLLSVPSTLTHLVGILAPDHPNAVWIVVAIQAPSAIVILFAAPSAYRPNLTVTAQVVFEAVMIAASMVALVWYLALRPSFDGASGPWLSMVVICTNAMVGGILVVVTIRNARPFIVWIGVASMVLVAMDGWSFILRLQHDSLVPVALSTLPSLLAWCVLARGLPRFGRVQDSSPDVLARSDAMREWVIGGAVGVFILAVVVNSLLGLTLGPFEWTLLITFIMAMWMRDVTQGRRNSILLSGMRDLALHDALTGLPNRRALESDIEWSDRQDQQPVSMLTIDIDQFKDVNDLMGHETGNRLLVTLAELLREAGSADEAVAYRAGGDEFVMMAATTRERAESLAQRIVEDVRHAGDRMPGVGKLNIGASVGVRHLPANAAPDDLRRALVQSGHAMRTSKRQGRGRVTVFDGHLERDYRRRKLIELQLREMCDSHAPVELHYQPILALPSRRVAGVEALARFHHPVLGPVPPHEFIDVAEGSGLITVLGERILRQSVSQLTAPGMLGRDIVISVNVSVLQLREVDFADRVLALLAEYGVPRKNLLIEVTESVFVDPASVAAATHAELAAAGVHLAIDDFGAGATSVGYLHTLPVTSVKIDRSIVQATDNHSSASGILRGVVEMARPLNLSVIVEGVETVEQERLARDLNVQYSQGWLYSKAVPAAELPAVIDALDARAAAPARVPEQSTRS